MDQKDKGRWPKELERMLKEWKVLMPAYLCYDLPGSLLKSPSIFPIGQPSCWPTYEQETAE